MEELRVRANIRSLLLESGYVHTHLTVDYMTVTADAVSELLSTCLFEIPLTADPTLLLTLQPSDPFDTLSKIYGLHSLQPYEEKLFTKPETIQHIKKALSVRLGNSKTAIERIWNEDEADSGYDLQIHQPMSPVLTLKSIRETPKLGARSHPIFKSIPTSYLDFLSSSDSRCPKIQITEAPPVDEAQIVRDDALNLRPIIHAETHTAMSSLLKSVHAVFPSSRAAGPPKINQEFNDFLRGYSSTSLYDPPEPQFMPIFPRVNKRRSHVDPHSDCTTSHTRPSSMVDLASVILPKVKMEDEEVDLYKEHMVVINGWQTYNNSSPSDAPSRTSSQSQEEIDELELRRFLLSSPNTDIEYAPDLAIKALNDAKIDEIEFPRAEKIHGLNTKIPVIGEDKTLGTFLTSILPGLPKSTIPVSEAFREPSPAPSSMLGQPPSALERLDGLQVYPNPTNDVESFDIEVKEFYASVQHEDKEDIILKAKLDDAQGQDRFPLMEVPVLPSPNQHSAANVFLPADLQQLLAPLPPKPSMSGQSCPSDAGGGYLKKAKGLKSLTIELSWRPFKFDGKPPSHEDLAGVQTILANGDIDADVKLLLDQVLLTGDFLDKDHWRGSDSTRDAESHIGSSFSSDVAHCEIVLTREERRRLAGVPYDCGDPEDVAQDFLDRDGPDLAPREDAVDYQAYSQRPLKRLRASLNDSDGHVHVDDSGISIPHGEIFQEQSSMPVHGMTTELCDSFPQDADKENMPPVFSPRLEPFGHSYDESQLDTSELFDYDHAGSVSGGDALTSVSGPDVNGNSSGVDEFESERAGFMPLSFDSYQATSAQQSQIQMHGTRMDGDSQFAFGPDSMFDSVDLDPMDVAMDRDSPIPRVPKTRISRPILSIHALGISEFTKLRAKAIAPHEHPPDDILVSTTAEKEPASSMPTSIPAEFIDANTLQLPSDWTFPTSLHRYMASLELLQKQTLVRCLRSRACAVDFVERDTLAGVDLILDPHSAIIFVPLLSLPSECDTVTSLVAKQSWRYSSLLLIFEAYPASYSYKPSYGAESTSTLNAYSPPILKAIKKLRRDLGIAEACGDKNTGASVFSAFSNTVEESAAYTRIFGDFTESNDQTRGDIWGDREWLDDEGTKDERDLASADGMNAFAAFVVLCQINLEAFLDMAAEVRIEYCGRLIGDQRIMVLNTWIERRLQEIGSSDPLEPGAE